MIKFTISLFISNQNLYSNTLINNSKTIQGGYNVQKEKNDRIKQSNG